MLRNDDGLLKLSVEVNGQEHSVTVDVYEANDRLYWMETGTTPEQQETFWQQMQTWCKQVGLPENLSRYAMSKMRSAVFTRMAELQKKDLPATSSETPG